jgi:hypothetical protein
MSGGGGIWLETPLPSQYQAEVACSSSEGRLNDAAIESVGHVHEALAGRLSLLRGKPDRYGMKRSSALGTICGASFAVLLTANATRAQPSPQWVSNGSLFASDYVDQPDSSGEGTSDQAADLAKKLQNPVAT